MHHGGVCLLFYNIALNIPVFMNVIKRLDAIGVSEKLGLPPATANFIFKPADKTPDHKFEPHRSEMYTLALILKGGADLTIGVDHYHV